MQMASGDIKRVVAIRLAPGEGVLEGLQAACVREKIHNGVVLSGIGSLNGATYLNPVPIAEKKAGYGYGKAIVLPGPIELVGMSGVICQGEEEEILLHIHCSLSDQYGNGHGGHLIEGNTVLLTVEIVVGELGDVLMWRRYDEDLGIYILDPVERQV